MIGGVHDRGLLGPHGLGGSWSGVLAPSKSGKQKNEWCEEIWMGFQDSSVDHADSLEAHHYSGRKSGDVFWIMNQWFLVGDDIHEGHVLAAITTTTTTTKKTTTKTTTMTTTITPRWIIHLAEEGSSALWNPLINDYAVLRSNPLFLPSFFVCVPRYRARERARASASARARTSARVRKFRAENR